MVVRKYRQPDHSSLVALWETVFPDDPPHNQPAAVIAAKMTVDDLIFVAEHEGALIGACMAGYDGHRGWLYAVAVLPDQRRSGIGASLVKQAMRSLRELGCVKVNLQIRAPNTEVAAFYEALGFAAEDRLSMGALLDQGR